MSEQDGGRLGRLAPRDDAAHHFEMPRRARDEAPEAIHHVVAKGSGGESLVRDDRDREVLVDRIGFAVRRHRWSCLAYCLLDTHFHLMVATPSPNLGRGMQWLLAQYARDFNDRHERQGNLFHTRFYSVRVKSDEHLVAALVYVHLNPVRAGVTEHAELWRWSSFAATVGLTRAPDFLDTAAVLKLIDEHKQTARLQLQLAVKESLERDRARAGVRHGV